MENLIANISEFIPLNTIEKEAIKHIIKVKKLKKKDHLLIEGQIADFVIYIESGCLRYYYLNNGEDITGQFFFENGWYSDFESYVSGNPTKKNVEALEDCIVNILYKKDLEKLYSSYPIFERFAKIKAETAAIKTVKKNEELLMLSNTERYLYLIKERPKVLERISQKYIASYLGMKPESLSRIRKQIFER